MSNSTKPATPATVEQAIESDVAEILAMSPGTRRHGLHILKNSLACVIADAVVGGFPPYAPWVVKYARVTELHAAELAAGLATLTETETPGV